jgi:hypothetical protein
MKNSLTRYSSFHEARTPAKVTIPVKAMSETEMPSTPTLKKILNDLNQR